ncbi:MAG: response regulator [Alphaproteobacteria bacterium]
MPETRIIIVDDDLDVLSAHARFLRLEGFEVAVSSDAASAWARLSEEAFDLMITDLKMPGDDGLALTQWVREAIPDLPIFLISGMASTPEVVEAMRLGAVDFIEKPVDPDVLVEKIRAVVSSASAAEGPMQRLPVAGSEARPLTDRVRAFEKHLLEQALRESGGSVKETMKRLGLSRRTLNEKMARLGVKREG